MNRVVDTSAWIEGFVKGGSGSPVGVQIPRRSFCIVPTMVQYELAKWLGRELKNGGGSLYLAYTQECIVVDLNTTIALRAAELGSRHKLAAADAIIYATALEKGADLLTCDAHFKDLPSVIYVPKPLN